MPYNVVSMDARGSSSYQWCLQTFSVYAPINADNRENIIVLRDILLPLYAHGQANVHLDGSMVYVKGKNVSHVLEQSLKCLAERNIYLFSIDGLGSTDSSPLLLV